MEKSDFEVLDTQKSYPKQNINLTQQKINISEWLMKICSDFIKFLPYVSVAQTQQYSKTLHKRFFLHHKTMLPAPIRIQTISTQLQFLYKKYTKPHKEMLAKEGL